MLKIITLINNFAQPVKFP